MCKLIPEKTHVFVSVHDLEQEIQEGIATYAATSEQIEELREWIKKLRLQNKEAVLKAVRDLNERNRTGV